MKRWAMALLAMLFIAGLVKTGFAGEVGPIQPLGDKKSEIAVEYNGIMDRDLDQRSGDVDKGQVESSNQVYVKGSLGIMDNFNVYAKLGMADYEQKVTWNAAGNNRTQTISYDYGLFWGLGGNCLYDLGNNLGIGGDVQFDMGFNDADSVTGETATTSFVDKGSVETYEFQTAAYLTYTIERSSNLKSILYGGGYYSYFKASTDDVTKYQDSLTTYTLGTLKGSDNFGLLAGANIATTDNITFNIEGRFIAETAITVGVGCKF